MKISAIAVRIRKTAGLLFIAIAALAVPLASGLVAQGQHHAAPPSLRLYVFDCGNLKIDPAPYGFTKDQLATTEMSVPCFLIAHPKGTLMWDVGTIPDSAFKATGPTTFDRATATQTLKSQLAEVGYSPSDITYLALSHCHWDHTANANEFASATWLAREDERDAMLAHPPEYARCLYPENYSALRNSKTTILHNEDYDVFGDGTVVLKSAPGHAPGHQVLFLKLRTTGPILLSGDLYHYPEERAQHKVPTTDFNREQTAASRAAIEEFLKKTGTKLWIQHDFTANAKLKKAPAYYE
jgi:glyoxylase-like metal-dependent hydrolase (beta-lactamase superfamily II)